MTKKEAYEQIFKGEKASIEGVNWNEEADEEFISELKKIKEMIERVANEHII